MSNVRDFGATGVGITYDTEAPAPSATTLTTKPKNWRQEFVLRIRTTAC
ncbi:MAG: hypothetical protein ACKVHE_20010 [Planctomycetales bacterium]